MLTCMECLALIDDAYAHINDHRAFRFARIIISSFATKKHAQKRRYSTCALKVAKQ